MKKCTHEWIDAEDLLRQIGRMPHTRGRIKKFHLKCWRCGYIRNVKMDIFEEDSENFMLDYKFR